MLAPCETNPQRSIPAAVPFQFLHKKRGVAGELKVPAICKLAAGYENATGDLPQSHAEMAFEKPEPRQIGAFGNRYAEPDSGKGIGR